MTKERFYVPAHGPDKNALQTAIQAFKILCEKYDSNGLICVPALKHAENTILNQIWAEKSLKDLVNGKSLKINERQLVSMCSQQTLKNHPSAQVILALLASNEMINKVERTHGCNALVILPWILEDAELWVKAYAPQELSLA